MRPNKFTQGHLLKIEWLFTDVTAVGSPGRAERAIFGFDFGLVFFGQFRPFFLG